MDKIAIQLKEQNNVARINEPVSLGIPFPKSSVRTVDNLALMNGEESLKVQLSPLAHWPDGSIRWVHASFLASLEANSTKELTLAKLHSPIQKSQTPPYNQVPDSLTIPTSTGRVVLRPAMLAWQTTDNDVDTPWAVTFSDETALPCTVKADKEWEVTHQGCVFVTATLKGRWLTPNNELLARFRCELRIYLETGLIQVELTTHNPKRACHPGGLWDLGDPGSVYFRELAIEATLSANSMAQVIPQATDNAPNIFPLRNFNLYQDSSGGENWHSHNHIDHKGNISTQFCGYRLSGINGLLHEDKRANPRILIEHESTQLDIAIPGFWENFPTSVRKEANKLAIGLFPKDAHNTYELQGGERKALRCLIATGPKTNIAATAYTPLVPTIAPAHFEQTGAFPWFKANTQPGSLDKLIATGLNGHSNFFAKREVIDEFGWRNFGDLFADHETLYQTEGEPPFISHYNNQYDPIYGFARQFALTGDKRWFELMDDLARHVADIDIYRTEQDRAEYNNGLFWHTDHYLDAHTATHRTFSRHNDTSSTPGQTGGGPAAEHCYTTGLLYHYLLTGAASSKEAALKLAGWMVATHEGTGGILEALLTIKNQDLPKLKALAKGQSSTSHRYPFTRGTGNYLTALIDASILEPNKSWLSRADAVIRATIHPKDNIVDRNLLNVETGWSYLILLSAITRYLYVKRQNNELDNSYQYAAACFMAYAEWMRNNETLFLADPEQLEFPNHTWVAQDIRKAMLMFQAAEFATEDQAKSFQNTGEAWLAETCETLKHSDECEYSRILVILMQNYGPHINAPSIHHSTLQTPGRATNKSTQLNWTSLMSRILMRLGKGIVTFSPAREKAWLDARLNRL
jgi:hypothetical protein